MLVALTVGDFVGSSRFGSGLEIGFDGASAEGDGCGVGAGLNKGGNFVDLMIEIPFE